MNLRSFFFLEFYSFLLESPILMADKIRISRNEFLFAIDCMHAVLSDGSLKWKPRISPRRCKKENKLCTKNVITAVRYFASGRLARTTEYFFNFWFDPEKNRSTPVTFKQLAELITSDFCIDGFATKRFLEFCATIAELAALAYVKKDSGAPDFAILCIYQAIRYYKVLLTKKVWKIIDTFAAELTVEYRKILPTEENVNNKRSDKNGNKNITDNDNDSKKRRNDSDDDNQKRKSGIDDDDEKRKSGTDDDDEKRKSGTDDDDEKCNDPEDDNRKRSEKGYNKERKSDKDDEQKKRKRVKDDEKRGAREEDYDNKKRKSDQDDGNKKQSNDKDDDNKKRISDKDDANKKQI